MNTGYNKKLKKAVATVILCALFFNSFLFARPVIASEKDYDGKDFYSDFSFAGDNADYGEFIHLLLAKLVYDDLTGYEGKSVSEYVLSNGELYNREIWEGCRIAYDRLYSFFVSDYIIYKIFDENDASGLYSVVFKKGTEVILAYRGSDTIYKSPVLSESNDWVNTDFRFALWNELSGQFDDADKCIDYIVKTFGAGAYDITFTGHSLGGALVAYSSIRTNYYGYSFDGAVGHVIDLIYSDRYLWIDDYKGVDRQSFCNYTDEKGYRVADIIQHTNAEAMYGIDRKTNLEGLNENTFFVQHSAAASHIIWSTVAHDGNTISLTEKVGVTDEGFTYAPKEAVSIDIAKPVSKLKDVITALLGRSGGSSIFSTIKLLAGTLKDRKLMLASSDGGSLSTLDLTTFIGGYTSGSILFGGSGDDYLVGYKYNDVLIAGTGDDVLNGGEGDDKYVISANEGKSTSIIDQSGVTRIMFKNMGIEDKTQLSFSQDTLIFKNNQRVVLSIKDMEKVRFYAFDNGRIKFLGDYCDIVGVDEKND